MPLISWHGYFSQWIRVGLTSPMLNAELDYYSRGTIPSGQTTTRTRYTTSSVAFGSSCDNVKEVQTGICIDGTITFSGSAKYETCTIDQKPSECIKNEKIKCKAGLIQSKKCEIPSNLKSIRVDSKSKGSSCHLAPSKIENIWDAIKIINSYSIEKSTVRANFGCDIQFDVESKYDCSK